MKKHIVFFICFATITFYVNAQDKVSGPEIQFDHLVHDFGKVIQGDLTECTFTFKNVGNEPLILSNVQSSCGCTVPSWPKNPVLPGQSEKITVKYNSNNVGAINKQVTVLSNAHNSPAILKISGNVQAKPQEILPVQPQSAQPVPMNK